MTMTESTEGDDREENENDVDENERVVLILGSCGLDRLLMVPTYPTADSKVRTTSYHEIGGGNAANTASAMGLLSNAAFLREKKRKVPLKIRLCTKIGGDYVGKQIVQELQQSGVDISSPLFHVGKTASQTTSFTTIIVSAQEQTRTCLHTPGTCGELELCDLDCLDMDEIFQNVIHFHSDARHTDVALALAKEARKRNISVSLDVEKDRNTPALDSLLNEATIIFTNSDQIQDYLTKLNHELEVSQRRECLPSPSHVVVPPTSTSLTSWNEKEQTEIYAHAIQPSAYFTRWFPNPSVQKEVVITKGARGALHVTCDAVVITEEQVDDGIKKDSKVLNKVQVEIMSSSSDCNKKENGEKTSYHHQQQQELVHIRHIFVDTDKEEGHHGGVSVGVGDCTKTQCRRYSADYTLRSVGILPNCPVVDTTGAGDAFIGGFLLARLATEFPIEACMKFGSWVGGQKIQGPGARSSLPHASQANEMLGSNSAQVLQTLDELIGKFCAR